jgi:hypothetical protein
VIATLIFGAALPLLPLWSFASDSWVYKPSFVSW